MNKPVERKVYAGTIGALSSTIVTDYVLWQVDYLWWPEATENIPLPVANIISAIVVTVVTFLSGYLAKSNPEFAEEV